MGNAKKSMIQIGLFSIPVRLEVAVDDDSSGTHTVCTGHGTHEPTRVKNHVDCPHPECSESHSSVWGYSERGIEREDGTVVLVTAEEIAEANGAPIKELALGFHPREKVYAGTFPADSVKYVTPDKGGERGYRALLDALTARPNLVATTVHAPSTKNALWVLEVVDHHLVLSKRCWPEDVRAKPAIAPAEVTDAEAEMFGNLVDALVTDFDVAEYRDARKDGMAALIASRMGTTLTAAPVAAGAAPTTDMLSALQATLDAVKPAPKRAAKKATKRPAKKVAKKAPAKKVAARKETAA